MYVCLDDFLYLQVFVLWIVLIAMSVLWLMDFCVASVSIDSGVFMFNLYLDHVAARFICNAG